MTKALQIYKLKNKYVDIGGNANVSQHQFFLCNPMYVQY